MGQAPRGESCNSDGNGTMFVKVGEFGSLFPQEINWITEPKHTLNRVMRLLCRRSHDWKTKFRGRLRDWSKRGRDQT